MYFGRWAVMGKARRQDLGFALNDLRVVSVIMGLLVIFSVTFETTDMTIPAWYSKGQPTGNNNGGGGGNNTTDLPVEVEVLSRSAYTSEGQTTTVSFDLGARRVLELKATLTWTDDYGSNDDIGLALSNSSGEMDTTHGTGGSLDLDVKAPAGGFLLGPFEAKVTAINCPGLVGPLPVDRDNGNDWSLTVKATVEG